MAGPPSRGEGSSVTLLRAAARSALPVRPGAKGLQLLVELGIAHQLFDLRGGLPLAEALGRVGDPVSHYGGDSNVLPELRHVHLVEGVGSRVVVRQVVRLCLV